MSAAGWSVLPISISLKGVQSAISRGMSGPLAAEGKKAAKTLESSMKSGADAGAKAVVDAQKRAAKASEGVAAAEKAVSAAREKSAAEAKKAAAAAQAEESARLDASIKVEQAEQAYQKLKASGKATAEQLATAEKKVEKARLDGSAGIEKKEAAAITARKKAADAAEGLEKSEKDLTAAHRKLDDATDNVQSAMNRAKTGMAEAKVEAKGLKGSISDLGNTSGSASGFMGDLGGKIGALAKFAGPAIGGMLGFTAVKDVLYGVGAAFDDMDDSIRVGTGASGAAFDRLTESARKVADTVPAMDGGMEQIGTTLADLNTRLGLTGPELETMTSQFIQLQNLGIEADINDVTGAFTQFGIEAKEAPAALDDLFRISQATGRSITDITSNLSKSGPALQEFGFGLQESAGLLGALDKAGLDSEKTLASMTKALSTFAAEGKNPQQALWGTVQSIDELTAAGKGAEAIDLANSIFGARGGAGFVAAVKSGKFEYDDFMYSLGASGDTILGVGDETADLAEKWTLFKQKAQLAIEPVASAVFGALTPAVEKMSGAIGPVIEGLKDFGSKIGEFFSGSNSSFAPMLETIVGAFKSMLESSGDLVGSLKKLWDTIYPVLIPALKIVGAIIGVVVLAAIKAVSAQFKILSAVVRIVAAVLGAVGNAIVASWSFLVNSLKGAWENVGKPIFDAIGAIATWLWESVINPVVGWIIGRWDGLSKAWKILYDAYIAPVINWFGAKLSDLWNKWVLPIVNWIKGKWDDMGRGFQIVYDKYIQPVVSWIGSRFADVQRFIDILKGVWDSLRDKVTEVINSVKEKIAEMVDKVTGIKDTVVNALSGAGKWLYDTGRNIVQGIIDGIGSMMSAIGDALLSIVPGPVRGAVRAALGLEDGGVAYADGGIAQAEAFANGGMRGENHVAQIARSGEWRVWAEDETGGEAYIPLAPSKRPRSKAILAKTAELMGLHVVDAGGSPVSASTPGGTGPRSSAYFANGGIRTAREMLDFARGRRVGGVQASRSLEGAPYVFGGSEWGDCSATASAAAAFMRGINPFPRKFTTMDEASVLRQYGFNIGRGPAGTLRIGWMNGGPGGGHTSTTLPDGTNIEMGGNRGNGQIGGQAAAWNDPMFTDWAWIKAKDDKPDLSGNNPNSGSSSAGTTSGGDTNLVEVDSSNEAVAAAVTESTPTTWSGIAGDFAKTWTEGMVQDALGVFGISDSLPPIFQAGQKYLAADEKNEGAAAVNDQIAEAGEAVHEGSQSAVDSVPEVKIGTLRRGEYKLGAGFFWEEIAKAASERRLGFEAAKIAGATALVESGDPLKMWASSVDTASQKYPHDSIGSDHDSSGIFQQRNNGAWGTIADRMNVRASAGMFLNSMVEKFPNWRSMEPGAVAQGVQVSAFPARYAEKMSSAERMLERFTGKLPGFANGTSRVTGGRGRGIDSVLALLADDEAVLTAGAADVVGRDTISQLNANPRSLAARANSVAESVGQGKGQGDNYYFQSLNSDELATLCRRATAGRVKGAMGAR